MFPNKELLVLLLSVLNNELLGLELFPNNELVLFDENSEPEGTLLVALDVLPNKFTVSGVFKLVDDCISSLPFCLG